MTEPEGDDTPEDAQAQTMTPPSLEPLTDPTKDPRSALAQTFESLNLRRIQLQNLVDMQIVQKASLETTQIEAAKMEEFYHQEIADTQAQLKESERQFGEVKKLYDATVQETASMKELITVIKAQNKKLLADLTQAQLRSAELIHKQNASLSMAP
jgi:hypothetical protein